VSAKLIAIVVAAALLFGAGFGVAKLMGDRNLAVLQSAWDKERAQLASDRADAITAQRSAEQKQADAIRQAATNYEKGKADAEQAANQTVADLRSGAVRLRDEWATCRATSAVVSSAASGRQPDAGANDREASAGRIVRAAAQCDAQVIGLQAALTGERVGQ